jgi:hypothetical protein
MTPRITLEDFNCFALAHIGMAGEWCSLTGRLSLPGTHYPQEGAGLACAEGDDIYGFWSQVDPDQATGTFLCHPDHLNRALKPGDSFPTCDDYWLPRVRLVLDEQKTWTRTRFIAPDAFEQPSPSGGRMWRAVQPGA